MATYRLLFVTAALAVASLLLGGASKPEPVTLTGTVDFHYGNPAYGGLIEPTGYVLAGQRDYEPLFLRKNHSLENPEIGAFRGQMVEVTGWLNYYSHPAINPDGPVAVTTYWTMDVTNIKAVAIAK